MWQELHIADDGLDSHGRAWQDFNNAKDTLCSRMLLLAACCGLLTADYRRLLLLVAAAAARLLLLSAALALAARCLLPAAGCRLLSAATA